MSLSVSTQLIVQGVKIDSVDGFNQAAIGSVPSRANGGPSQPGEEGVDENTIQ